MSDLPPDLDRLGHALTLATERAVTRRNQASHRRRRLFGYAVALVKRRWAGHTSGPSHDDGSPT
jgi:hypothetical protein